MSAPFLARPIDMDSSEHEEFHETVSIGQASAATTWLRYGSGQSQ